MIALNDVKKTFSMKGNLAVTAVNDINLKVEKGEFIVITGRSGSGKTTLLNLIAGIARPTSGQVLINDIDIWNLSDAERSNLRNRIIGFVFQFPSLYPSLTVLDNVVLPTIFSQAKRNTDSLARAKILLDQVGLSDKLSAYPRHLSAGQQQRVVVARSLINDPELLLADEPTSNLDEQSEQEIISLFQEIHHQDGITIMLVTHSGHIVTAATRTLTITTGSIIQDDRLKTLLV
jgi:ABC-type lipoprotein export system ATPase subunit